MEELLKNLKDAREKNKKEFEKRKIVAKEILDEAKHTVLLATESKGIILGTKLDVMNDLAQIFNSLIRQKKLDEDEIIQILAMVIVDVKKEPSYGKLKNLFKKIMKDLGVKYE